MEFEKMFTRLLGHEGGYVNDSKDSGGETNWGISKRAYPNVNIKTLTSDEAKIIYLRDFWNPLNAEKLHDGVAWQLFDFAVNSGISTAIRHYQKALGVVDDGHFGPRSFEAAAQMSESDQIMRVIAERIKFMVKCKTWATHGAGWMNRMATNLYFGAADS